MQHYRLHRDIEIAVVDAARGLGNGRMLPSGPLRESPSRLSQVDFVVLNGSGADIGAELDLVGAHHVELQALGLRHIASNVLTPVDMWKGGKKAHAVCGIGHPDRFAQTLTTLGFEVILSSVNDHQHLSSDDLTFGDDLPVIITSKDAVKYSGVIPENLWVLEVEMSISDDFVDSLTEQAGLTITAT